MKNYLARIDELLANQRKKLIEDRDEKVLGEEETAEENKESIDYSSNKFPTIYLSNASRYIEFKGGYEITSGEMQAIAENAKEIYQKNGIKLNVVIIPNGDVDNPESQPGTHIDNLRNKKYGIADAFVQIRYSGDSPVEDVTRFQGVVDTQKPYRPTYSIVGYNSGEGTEPTYYAGWRVAHETLHQFLNNANFLIHNVRTGTTIENDEETGHTNSSPNLNMSGAYFGREEWLYAAPKNLKRDANRLRPAERIFDLNLLYTFFKRNGFYR